MFYAVSCGEALHIIPAEGHNTSDSGDLVIHGREEHSYGPADWDVVMWADSRENVLGTVGRIKLAPRLQS